MHHAEVLMNRFFLDFFRLLGDNDYFELIYCCDCGSIRIR